MLRKRSRSHQKDHHQQMGNPKSDAIPDSSFQSDALRHKHKTHNSFFNSPGLFVGFSPKSPESDSVRSPTSPLDFRVFSNLANSFRSPRSSHGGRHQKSWDCPKVGLGIIDSLDDDRKQSEKILRSSDSRNVLFGPQIKIKTPNFPSRIDSLETPKSLPKSSYVLFGMGEKSPFEPFGKILSCSLDSGRSGSNLTSLTNPSSNSSPRSGYGTNPPNRPPQIGGGTQDSGNPSATKLSSIIPVSNIGSAHDFFGSISASEIELSEDYTCVKTYGPNPKTTHIFGDCILECHNNNLAATFSKNEEQPEQVTTQLPPAILPVKCLEEIPSPYPSSDFLSFCYSCKKKLEGEDIYIYRGEKAFCSWGCRSEEILIEEAMERVIINGGSPGNSPKPNHCEELFETTMFIATT
ncbi:hypothetical protein U1Q18_021784 [Sarracenia purpurea var. burkii]